MLWSTGSGCTDFSSCVMRALMLHGMWNLSRAGIEPKSSSLASGFLFTIPPGESWHSFLMQFPGLLRSRNSQGCSRKKWKDPMKSTSPLSGSREDWLCVCLPPGWPQQIFRATFLSFLDAIRRRWHKGKVARIICFSRSLIPINPGFFKSIRLPTLGGWLANHSQTHAIMLFVILSTVEARQGPKC